MPSGAAFSVTGVERAIGLVEVLRGRGYPVPRYLDVGEIEGSVYSVQERVAGAVPDVLGVAHARRLLDLVELHADAADPDAAWSRTMVDAMRIGTEALWTDHAVLRTAEPRVVALLEEVIELGLRTEPEIFRQTDVVHGDFHHRNLLAVGDDVAAVFDWESATVGDARSDLAKLAFWCEAAVDQVDPAARAVVVEKAEELIPPDVFAAFSAVTAVQLLTFAVRARPELFEWMLDAVVRAAAPRWRSRP
jgi:aminoglycoside phosphotransferase (APT) family kinase protein